MEFFTTDLDGVTRMEPGAVDRLDILTSVEEAVEADYPEVYLTSGKGIVLGYRRGGILLWEEEGQVLRTLGGISPAKAAEAWTLLAGGEVEALQALPWKPWRATGERS
ncbi:MAG: hypothetical protein AB3N64_14095 [Puniceicoccaceae bacterium]